MLLHTYLPTYVHTYMQYTFLMFENGILICLQIGLTEKQFLHLFFAPTLGSFSPIFLLYYLNMFEQYQGTKLPGCYNKKAIFCPSLPKWCLPYQEAAVQLSGDVGEHLHAPVWGHRPPRQPPWVTPLPTACKCFSFVYPERIKNLIQMRSVWQISL